MKRFLGENYLLIFLSMVAGVAIVSSVKYPELSPVSLLWRSIGSVISLYLLTLFWDGFHSVFKADAEEVETDGEATMIERVLIVGLITVSVLLWA